MARVLQTTIEEADLLQLLGSGRARLEIVRWPGETALAGDRQFLQALDGDRSFEQACEQSGASTHRAAALCVVLLALGFAIKRSGLPPADAISKFKVPSWTVEEEEFSDLNESTPVELVEEEQGEDVNEFDHATGFGEMPVEISAIDKTEAIYDPEEEELHEEEDLEDEEDAYLSSGSADIDAESDEDEALSIETLYAKIKRANYYDILGVSQDAHADEISQAYQQTLDELSEHLCDLRPELLLMADKVAQGLTEAYQVLSHPRLAERYRQYFRPRS
jgi:hypothetical protein